MQRFVDDDARYLGWIAQNPDGFVLNTERKPTPTYLVLHRATCRTIGGTPARGDRWTTAYQKVCGTRSELELWATQEVHAEPRLCPLCGT
jgi:hypothetical protein